MPVIVPARGFISPPSPYANQRGNKNPLVTTEDYKGSFVAVRLMSPLLYQLSYTARAAKLTTYDPIVKGTI